MVHALHYRLHTERFAICRLAPGAETPEWARHGPIWSVTRTPHELSVLCKQRFVPEGVRHEPGWRCIELVGPFPFEMTGVLASVLNPLAAAGIPILAMSTFDTDLVFVPDGKVGAAVKALKEAGHLPA